MSCCPLANPRDKRRESRARLPCQDVATGLPAPAAPLQVERYLCGALSSLQVLHQSERGILRTIKKDGEAMSEDTKVAKLHTQNAKNFALTSASRTSRQSSIKA